MAKPEVSEKSISRFLLIAASQALCLAKQDGKGMQVAESGAAQSPASGAACILCHGTEPSSSSTGPRGLTLQHPGHAEGRSSAELWMLFAP